eukprot:6181480-Pleurochrysis_carterae.AAC.1
MLFGKQHRSPRLGERVEPYAKSPGSEHRVYLVTPESSPSLPTEHVHPADAISKQPPPPPPTREVQRKALTVPLLAEGKGEDGDGPPSESASMTRT